MILQIYGGDSSYMSTGQNGKGDAPRNCFSERFRENFDLIKWSEEPRRTAVQMPCHEPRPPTASSPAIQNTTGPMAPSQE